MSWTYSFKNSDSRLLEQYKIIHRGYGLRLRQKLLLHCFVAHCIIRLSFSWRQTADHPRTFHTDTLSLHGLSVDQKLEVRTEIWSGTPCRPAADQQFAIFSRCLPVTRGRTWLHAGVLSYPVWLKWTCRRCICNVCHKGGGEMTFHAFWLCDLDLDPMTLIYGLDLRYEDVQMNFLG